MLGRNSLWSVYCTRRSPRDCPYQAHARVGRSEPQTSGHAGATWTPVLSIFLHQELLHSAFQDLEGGEGFENRWLIGFQNEKTSIPSIVF
jgi:hypothetical protein